MDLKAILPNRIEGASRPQKPPQGPPPPPHERTEEDSVAFSASALALQGGGIPDDLKTAMEDLQGDRKDLTSDLRAIGEYFSTQTGGIQAMNAFMEAHFSREDLDTFRQAAEAAGLGTPGSAR